MLTYYSRKNRACLEQKRKFQYFPTLRGPPFLTFFELRQVCCFLIDNDDDEQILLKMMIERQVTGISVQNLGGRSACCLSLLVSEAFSVNDNL